MDFDYARTGCASLMESEDRPSPRRNSRPKLHVPDRSKYLEREGGAPVAPLKFIKPLLCAAREHSIFGASQSTEIIQDLLRQAEILKRKIGAADRSGLFPDEIKVILRRMNDIL